MSLLCGAPTSVWAAITKQLDAAKYILWMCS